MSSELKPCPIPNCGGKAKAPKTYPSDGAPLMVVCEKCGFECHVGYWDDIPRPSEAAVKLAEEMRRHAKSGHWHWPAKLYEWADALDAYHEGGEG